MELLALDTSMRVASLAWCSDGQLLATASYRTAPAESLFTWIDALRPPAKTDLWPQLVAVGIGPGLFTGTRIAVSAAHGIAWACKIPIVGIGSLAALAETLAVEGVDIDGVVHREQNAEIVVDAGRGECYRFASDVVELTALTPAGSTPRLFVSGDSCSYWDGERESSCVFPNIAPAIARLGIRRFVEQGADEACLPLYIRPSDAERGLQRS